MKPSQPTHSKRGPQASQRCFGYHHPIGCQGQPLGAARIESGKGKGGSSLGPISPQPANQCRMSILREAILSSSLPTPGPGYTNSPKITKHPHCRQVRKSPYPPSNVAEMSPTYFPPEHDQQILVYVFMKMYKIE